MKVPLCFEAVWRGGVIHISHLGIVLRIYFFATWMLRAFEQTDRQTDILEDSNTPSTKKLKSMNLLNAPKLGKCDTVLKEAKLSLYRGREMM